MKERIKNLINYKKLFAALVVGLTFSFTLNNKAERVVSVNGTVTEIICALGLENTLVGTDITSTYPESVLKVPKVGHNRTVSAEGVLSLNPTVLVGYTSDLSAQTKDQLKTVKQLLYPQDYTIEGTKNLIRKMATDFNKKDQGELLVKELEKDLTAFKKPATKKKILFIYARGAGTMMVSGTGTSVDAMIKLAGLENAASGFNDYKPLTTEALITANPDVILMFDSGLKSMGGIDGVLEVQGVSLTKAGQSKKIISMDGQFLSGFGPRLGKALQELVKKAN